MTILKSEKLLTPLESDYFKIVSCENKAEAVNLENEADEILYELFEPLIFTIKNKLNQTILVYNPEAHIDLSSLNAACGVGVRYLVFIANIISEKNLMKLKLNEISINTILFNGDNAQIICESLVSEYPNLYYKTRKDNLERSRYPLDGTLLNINSVK